MVVLWSAYHSVAFLVSVLCQTVHSLSHPYISQIPFKKSFHGDLFLFFFDIHNIVVRPLLVPLNYLVIVWAATCSIKMVSIAMAHCLEIVGRPSMQTIVSLQTKYKRTFFRKFSHSQWPFNCVTSRIKVLGWLEKKEDEQFCISTASSKPPQNSF